MKYNNTTATSSADNSSINATGNIGDNATTSSINNNTNSATTSTTTLAGSNSATSTAFCEQVSTVTNLFEKWSDCERTVVMYALLKRLPYSSLKFLQYSIDSSLAANQGSQPNLSTVVIDINANNPSYLQNLLNAYKTCHLVDLVDTLSSSSSDKDSMPYYGSDFQLTQCDERKLYQQKRDVLHELLNLLPMLKPGNDDAKLIYLALMPIAVKDTMRQIVPTELVQQIFSYLLIHPAFSSEDRRSLNIWLRHLEEHVQTSPSNSSNQQQQNFFVPTAQARGSIGSLNIEHTKMTTSGSSTCSASTNSSCSASCSSVSNASAASSSIGNLAANCPPIACCNGRSADWQTIAPPSKQQHQQQQQQMQPTKTLHDWSTGMASASSCAAASSGCIADQICDNLNGINLNELASSQNSLGLSLGAPRLEHSHTSAAKTSTLVNGLAAAAAVSAAPGLFGGNANPIINIMNNNNNNCSSSSNLNGADDHDTSFSKNGTEILDFEPNPNSNACDTCSSNNNSISMAQTHQQQQQQQMPYASILMSNCEHLDINRWSLDSKLAALKTRRSNSLTTQTISSSASSSNSSVITVNDNCSNSTENLAQYANKPRSFSLSIEHQRGVLANSGSDTRLDEFKPNYIKFHTRNVGMSSIGLWLKSLRLHKYIDLFKNMTYEEMLHISEDYLHSLGVTKGASHKLALCIEKLKERPHSLVKLEQDLLSGQLKVQQAVEDLANIVLTPMKPVELVNVSAGEENVALLFLQVVDLVCSIVQKDPYTAQDDESLSVIMWILDRSIHNEAFVNHVGQLKELKFKFSKLKMALTPKMHHAKNSNGGNLNKPRWNGKTRKCDPKNGSNDRINHRKNSNDMLNFSLSCLQQQHHNHHNGQQQQQPQADYEKFNHHSNNGSSNQQHQYKSSSYPNFITQQQQQHLKQHHQQQQQQQMQQQMLQQHTHFPALPQHQHQLPHQQHRRSLNNLILVSGGPQQAQKMMFKPGQGILSAAAGAAATTSSADNLQMEQALKCQQRKASLPALNNNGSCNLAATFTPVVNANPTTSTDAAHQQQQQLQQQQPKKTMAAVVMVSSNDDLAAAVSSNMLVSSQQSAPQILINNNNNSSNMLNNNLICQQQQLLEQQQQQQQLQLLAVAVAAAAVGSSCNLNNSQNVATCLCSNNNSSSSSGSNNNNSANSSCSSCSNLPTNFETAAITTPHITNMNTPLCKTTYPLANSMNDIRSLEQLETLCLQMTEQAIN